MLKDSIEDSLEDSPNQEVKMPDQEVPSNVAKGTSTSGKELISSTALKSEYEKRDTSVSISPKEYQGLLGKMKLLEEKLSTISTFTSAAAELGAKVVANDYDVGADEEFDSEDEYFHERRYRHEMYRDLRYFFHRWRREDYFAERQMLRRRDERKKPTSVDAEPSEALVDITAKAIQMLLDGIPATLLPMEWESFKIKRGNIDVVSNPIELLIGEPEVTFDFRPLYSVEDAQKIENGPPKISVRPVLVKGDDCPGLLPLPERIRIRSPDLIKILVKLGGPESSSYKDQISILRPFKSLIYYERDIRRCAEKLTKKFGELAARNDQEDSTPQNQTTPGDLAPKEVQDSDAPEESPIALLHIRCLLEFMDTELKAKLDYVTSSDCELISFNDLWHLFKPGDEVLEQGENQAYRIIRVASPEHKVIPPWQRFYMKKKENSEDPDESASTTIRIHCVYVDFDGEKFGPVSKVFMVPRFEGNKSIRALPIYPIRQGRTLAIRDKLIKRGKMLLDVASVKPMYYTGFTLDTKEEVDSQVVIDFVEALAEKKNEEWQPAIEVIGTSKEENENREECRADCCRQQVVYDDAYVEDKLSEDFVKSLFPAGSVKQPSLIISPRYLRDMDAVENQPTDEEFTIMTYRVFGFVLRSRKWAQLDLSYLKYENENRSLVIKNAFDSLVLPDGHREMIQSLVVQHFRYRSNQSLKDEKTDLVRGKGKGLILLLHGAPGVGKTTTAEGVAEVFKKPLFQITCGDLGSTAKDVEEELEKNFALASRWGCVLLLDEADVFLAARERKDFLRNGLVAVFLRVLEYYAGILFLTTNRVGDFDEAFASRIHMSLHYPELDAVKTMEIFRLNLEIMAESFQRQKRELKYNLMAIAAFAQKHWDDNEDSRRHRWNGRQIRNMCQTALALAEFEAHGKELKPEVNTQVTVELKLEYFHKIKTAYDDFAHYLGELYGLDSDERAQEAMLRALEYEGEKSRLSHYQKKTHLSTSKK